MLTLNAHRAYVLTGQRELLIPELLSLLEEKADCRVKNNPDFRSETYDVFGIDEARELKEAAYRRAVSGGLPAAPGWPAQAGKKIFVISTRGITKEAQNALLKVLEEPPEGTQFFLVVPSLELLLPTLRSRLHILPDISGEKAAKVSSSVADFLESPIPKRLKIIQGMLKAADEESDKQTLVTFLDDLERTVADKRGLKTRMRADANTAQTLSEILEVKKYSRDRAPSFKLLLEHLGLVLPQQ